ncbi:MAG: flagellar biosynthesis anti-sigma factor FlgM [Candidatus Aenigmatarchaeota archaeon]
MRCFFQSIIFAFFFVFSLSTFVLATNHTQTIGPSETGVKSYCGWCGDNCMRITPDTVCAAIAPPQGYSCVEENESCVVKKKHKESETCPLVPIEIPRCGPDEVIKPVYSSDNCLVDYKCVPTTVGTEVCPPIPPSNISCSQGQELTKVVNEKGCVVGYNCVPSTTEIVCPAVVPKKPTCTEGSVVPIFDEGCLIGYSCVPPSCRQETDSSGFVRVVCEAVQVCPEERQQEELKDICKAKGGDPVQFKDIRGCVYYDCRFEEKTIEIKPALISGNLSCPTDEENERVIEKCEAAGLSPSFVFERGCKIIKCSHPVEPVCRFPPESEINKVEGHCRSLGLPTIKAIDENGCIYFKCGETPTACPRDVPSEAYKKCKSLGGEMIVKMNEQGCITFSQCVFPGDVNYARVEPVKEVPDTTVLLRLGLKLEQLKVELDKLSREAQEIAKYYASVNSLDEERFNKVATMFATAADKVNEIKNRIKNPTLSVDDVTEIKYSIRYLKEVTLRDILYVMLSNSEDVINSLERSKKISVKSSFEEIKQNTKDCGTDGFCFERAFRFCNPVTFKPEGTNGPVITIIGVEEGGCVVKAMLPENVGPPPGLIPGVNPPYEMICRFSDYALGYRGSNDFLNNCQGNMVKIMKEVKR